MIRMIDDATVASSLDVRDLIEPIRRGFAAGCNAPQRTHVEIDLPAARPGVLLMMPAWTTDRSLGVKLVTVFPDNATSGLPAVSALYVLMSARTGEVVAIIAGGPLTLRRTAAVSALACDLLARRDARTLLLVGTGALVPFLARGHVAVRQFSKILVWGRSLPKAIATAETVAQQTGIATEAVANLAQAVPLADVISAATLSESPLIRGDWLRPGVHLDLVGSFRPAMRESDDRAVALARVFVDTHAALTESGDLIEPSSNGTIAPGHVIGELADLITGRCAGRTSDREITLFKSVGTALADLAAATYLLERVHAQQRPVAPS